MARSLPNPPKSYASAMEREQWEERLVRFVRPGVAISGDADASISSNSTYHGVTALTAGRELTLPSASDVLDGQEFIVQDESGDAGTHTITISASGMDTINGGSSVTIEDDYGRRRIIKRGSGQFFAD